MSVAMRTVTSLGIALAGAGASAQDPTPTPTTAPTKVSWKDGKTTIESDKALINISNRLQIRGTFEKPDDTVQLAGTNARGDSRGSFRVRRGRLKLDGWAYRKNVQYEVQIDWAAGGNVLQDLNINWDISNKRRFMLKVGQFKPSFGRQELTSSINQQLVDRSIVSTEFARSRDQGVQLWGELGAGKLEWRAGVFNGNGRTAVANDNGKYQYDARVMWQPWGATGYTENDFETKEGKPLLAVAVNVDDNDSRVPAATGAPATFRRTTLGGDVMFKWRRLSVMGEYFDRDMTPVGGGKFASNGFHVQAGYLFDAGRHWGVALRYASWDPSARVAGDDRREIGAGFNYFYNRDNLKVAADVRRLEDEGRKTKDHELRVQTQLIF
jgi:phosphate-selective porin OprO and OprP